MSNPNLHTTTESLVKLFVLVAALVSPGAVRAATVETKPAFVEIVLTDVAPTTRATIEKWKKERFKGVAVVLDDRTGQAACREMAEQIMQGGLDLYFWIEVGRNPKLASEHPKWMAALGTHEDWQKNFPKFPEPKVGEVAKVFPWVPIVYQEGFNAHLARIEQMIKLAPQGWRGLLLNDLQGGPSSCGCGNLQCRWAIDYHVHPTATKAEGEDVAARFLGELRKRVGDKLLIPVWTTECEMADLPAAKHQGRPGTGFCGNVGCATATCPDVFSRQFSSLATAQDGPIGILGVHSALQRTQPEFGGGPGWFTNALEYLRVTLPAHDAKAIPVDRLWVVVEGGRSGDEAIARKLARATGAGAVIVARSRVEQSYQPRLVPTK
jgi:hypothetical protein